MLAIRSCFFGSSKGGKHDKHKYNDIPSISKEGFHLNISSDPLYTPSKIAQPQPELALEDGDKLHMEPQSDNKTILEEARHNESIAEEAQHNETVMVEAWTDETLAEEAPPEKIIVEEPQHDEVIVEEAQPDKTMVEEARPDEAIEELAPLYKLLLEEPQESKLNQIFRDLIGPYKSPEELGDQSNNLGLYKPDCSSLSMCTEILGSESCDNMVKDMSEAVTEWSWSHKRQRKKAIAEEMLANKGFPPPIPRYAGRPCRFMKVERCNGRITMNEVVMDRQPEVMQIERDDGGIKMQLMTYVRDAENDDADETSMSTLFMVDAWGDDTEASTSAFNLIGDAWNDDAGATSTLHVGDAPKNDAEASTSAMNVVDAGDDDVEATTLAMYVEDAKNGDAEASASALYVGDARSHDDETSTYGSTSQQVQAACDETTNEEEEEATDESDSSRKGEKVAAKAA